MCHCPAPFLAAVAKDLIHGHYIADLEPAPNVMLGAALPSEVLIDSPK